MKEFSQSPTGLTPCTTADTDPAVIGLDGTKYSYAQLHRDAAYLANQLESLGTSPVAISCKDSGFFAAALIASVRAKVNVVLLPNHQPGVLLAYREKYDAIIADHAVPGALADDLGPALLEAPSPQQPASQFVPAFNLFGFNIRVTFYTSGSSGAPKAIAKTMEQLLSEVDSLHTHFLGDPTTHAFAATVSHQHIYGLLFKIVWPLKTGQHFYRDLVEFPEQLDLLPDNTILISSPTFLKRIQDTGTNHRSAIQMAFSSGGSLTRPEALSASSVLGAPVTEVLGSTETGGIAYRKQTAEGESQAWRPFPGVNISQAADGTLGVESPYSGGWQKTEDMIKMLSIGHFELLGRRDRIVKLGEKRLSLTEMERHGNDFILIRDCAVTTVNKGNQERVALAAELTQEGCRVLSIEGKVVVNNMIRKHLSEKFEGVTLPRYFRYVDTLPINPQGKRVISELDSLFGDRNT